jgi:ABC-2 type transport system ATP-binding protein
MIEVENISKRYGDIQALKPVSFSVAEGEIIGLLGHNGAGKSTTIKILTGYLHPDTGTVSVDGQDLLTHTQAVQAKIGYLPENTPLYTDMTVQAYLRLMARARNLPEAEQSGAIADALVATGLASYRTRLIGTLSKGLRQRVGLAQAILHKPKLLILDEPTVGLDPTQILEIRALIKRLAQNSTILFSSHILSEVEAVCSRVLILMNGELTADAHLNELAASPNAVLVLESAPDDAEAQIRALAGVRQVELTRSIEGWPAYRVLAEGDICPALFALAKAQDWPLRELRRDMLTLEAVFNRLAQHDSA